MLLGNCMVTKENELLMVEFVLREDELRENYSTVKQSEFAVKKSKLAVKKVSLQRKK